MQKTRQSGKQELAALIKEEPAGMAKRSSRAKANSPSNAPRTPNRRVRFSKDIKVEREIITTSKQSKIKTEDLVKLEPPASRDEDVSTKVEITDQEPDELL